MGKRAITVYSINVDTGSTVNMALNLKYISKFNSPFFKGSKELTVFFFFLEQTLNFCGTERLYS